jgi:hypothetical protein
VSFKRLDGLLAELQRSPKPSKAERSRKRR